MRIILAHDYPIQDIRRGRVYLRKSNGEYVFFANFWTEMDEINVKFYKKVIFNRDALCFELKFPSANKGFDSEFAMKCWIKKELVKLDWFIKN